MATRATISVVVVSFNTCGLLRQCLASLRDAGAVNRGEVAGAGITPLPMEVIVVDNASHDGSADMVEREFHGVQLVRSTENLGFARATNIGLSKSTGELLLLLNPDTEVASGALATMAEFLVSHPEVAVVSPSLEYPDGRPQHAAFRFPTLWMSLLDFFPLHHRLASSRLNGRYPPRRDSQPFRIDHPLGAAMMIRREALEDIGPMDEDFFIYCEEVDWCLRARRRGWKVYQVPAASITHHGGQSTGQFREEMLVRLHQSRHILFSKHYSPGFTRAHRAVTRLAMLMRVMQTRWAEARGRIAPERARDEIRAYRAIWRM